MTEYHHGVRIRENFDNAASVRDVAIATTFLIGTAPIHVLYNTQQARAPYINRMHIIRTAKDAAEIFGDPAAASSAGYTIPAALFSAFNKDPTGQGAGTYVVVNVFDPDVHRTNNTPDPTQVAAADLVGGISVGGAPYGLDLAYACFSKFGFFPKRIAAPGFTGLQTVRAKMEVVANKVHGHALWDMTAGMTKTEAITARGVGGAFNTASERVVLFYPRVEALTGNGGKSLQPYSQHFMGVWNAVVAQGGPHQSPSNRAMPDVFGTETDIFFMPGQLDSDTNLLNQAGIVTTQTSFGSGVNTYGAHSAKWATVADQLAWLHGRTVADAIHESILFYCLPWVDRLGTPANVDAVEERVRAWLNTKGPGGDGWVYGSDFYFDRRRNTAEQIANEGRFYYTLKFAVTGIMHDIVIDSYIDLAFVNTALGLVTG